MGSWGIQEYKVWPGARKKVKRWGDLRIVCASRQQALDMLQVMEASSKGGVYRVNLVDKPITHGGNGMLALLRKTCAKQQSTIELLEMKNRDLNEDVRHYKALAKERQVKVTTMLRKFRKAGL